MIGRVLGFERWVILGKKMLSMQELIQKLELMLPTIAAIPIDDVDVESRRWRDLVKSIKKCSVFVEELDALKNIDFGEIGSFAGIGNNHRDDNQDRHQRSVRRENGIAEARNIIAEIKQSRFHKF